MKFIWSEKDYQEKFSEFIFSKLTDKLCDTMYVCAVDEYTVFINGKFVCYGPYRTASGYVRPQKISVSKGDLIEVKVTSIKAKCFSFDMQKPFFGAEIKSGDKVVFDSSDFTCFYDNSRLHNVTRYSKQRGYLEIYDLRKNEKIAVNTVEVQSPVILNSIPDRSDYSIKEFNMIKEGTFHGFDLYDNKPWWFKVPGFSPKETDFINERDFFNHADGFNMIDYELDRIATGFIKLSVQADEDTEIFVAFEEIKPDGKWKFYRSANNDFIKITVGKGSTEFISATVYDFKYLKVIYNGNAKIVPQIITVENNEKICVSLSGNEKIKKIFDSAVNTFRQNAIDIFMDCPGRERGGYLCDAFFTAKTERFFFNNNNIEKDFLTNYLLSVTDELPKGMLPACFPSQPEKDFYIPNWAMWFNIEICDYYKRTKDLDFIKKAKDKVYGVIDFFDKYLNEYELLEDLESWVFIEWSICNDKDYTKCVNFPTNMLFSKMLYEVGNLYGDKNLLARSEEIKKSILRISYNGSYFVDNAVRIKGKLMPCKDHLSETCQYYAIFAGLCPDDGFSDRILDQFGPLSEKMPENMGKSNMFIGHYLRFLWLNSISAKDRMVEEALSCFSHMAESTCTLWEKDDMSASCCHGFASVIAMFLASALVDYDEYKDLRTYNGEAHNVKYGVTIKFNYKD